MKKIISLIGNVALVFTSFGMVQTEKIPKYDALIQSIKNDTKKNFKLLNPLTKEEIDIPAGKTIQSFGIEIPTKYSETYGYYIRRGELYLINKDNSAETYKIDFSILFAKNAKTMNAYIALIKPKTKHQVDWLLAERILDFTRFQSNEGQIYIELILKSDDLSDSMIDMSAGFKSKVLFFYIILNYN